MNESLNSTVGIFLHDFIILRSFTATDRSHCSLSLPRNVRDTQYDFDLILPVSFAPATELCLRAADEILLGHK